MPKALPFTEASLARAIKGVERAGKFVVGVKPDGTLIVANEPLNLRSFLPTQVEETVEDSKWADRP